MHNYASLKHLLPTDGRPTNNYNKYASISVAVVIVCTSLDQLEFPTSRKPFTC